MMRFHAVNGRGKRQQVLHICLLLLSLLLPFETHAGMVIQTEKIETMDTSPCHEMSMPSEQSSDEQVKDCCQTDNLCDHCVGGFMSGLGVVVQQATPHTTQIYAPYTDKVTSRFLLPLERPPALS